MAHATGTSTVSSWDETTYEELDGGAKLTKATVSSPSPAISKLAGDGDAGHVLLRRRAPRR